MQTLVAALALAAALLQSPLRSTAKSDIELSVIPQDVDHGLPRTISFLLINSARHDVRLPVPAIQCEDSFDGSILLTVQGPKPPEGGGCASDMFGPQPTILERVATWKTLHPGETLIVSSSRDRFDYDDKQPGRYEFSAVYSAPSLKPDDRETLRRAGIEVSQGKAQSPVVVLMKPAV